MSCRFIPEQIVTLPDAKIGSYNIWTGLYGEQDLKEEFATGFYKDKWRTIVLGTSADDRSEEKTLVLAEFDRRGRTVYVHEYDVQGVLSPVKLIPTHEGHFWGLINARINNDHFLMLIEFDDQGQILSERRIKDKAGNLTGYDLIPIDGGKSYMLSATIQQKSKVSGVVAQARIYILNNKGNTITSRTFNTGAGNALFSLTSLDNDYVLATGYALNSVGRKTAWAMGVDHKGAVLWQQDYPRGQGAEIVAATPYKKGQAALIGTAKAAGGEKKAAWVMMINDASGDVLWQRYYTGEHSYEGRDITMSSDGVITVVANALSDEENDLQSFVRVLTINSTGQLRHSDEYFNGHGASAYQIATGPAQERILMGKTLTPYQLEQEADPVPETFTTLDGWVVVGAPPDPYDDPCF